MKRRFRLVYCSLVWLICSQSWAQHPDSTIVRKEPTDSLSIQRFLEAEGPAEAVFSFFSPHPYRFNSGVYTVSNPAFPLLYSPDSLVNQPIRRAHKQQRTARVAAIATAIPLLVLSYSVVRLVGGLGAAIAGKGSSAGMPDPGLIQGAGIASLVGITVGASFNIASLINVQRGIRRHNRLLGRRMPTLFNPKGL